MLNRHEIGLLFTLWSGKKCELSSDSYRLVTNLIADGVLEWGGDGSQVIYLASAQHPIALTVKGVDIVEDIMRTLKSVGGLLAD